VGRLLAFERDVENRVEPSGTGQRAAKLALTDADRVRVLAAPVEDARDQTLAAQAPRRGGAAQLALLYLDLDSFTGHGAGV
jgi:hypothetical protein